MKALGGVVPIRNCEKVIIRCSGRLVSEDEVRGRFVRKGDLLGDNCRVISAVVSELAELEYEELPCFVGASTSLDIKQYKDVEVAYKDEDVIVVWDEGSAYVYDREVIDEIINEYIQPIREGGISVSRGLLLMGPPGTGKSTLMNLLGEMTGFNIYRINPAEIYSKWLGESEQNLQKKLNEAVEGQPSIVLIDDLEWLALSRDFAGSSIVTGEWRYSLFNVLASFFDKINREQDQVLVVGATNVNKNILDPALVREGRFGQPRLIPPPGIKHVMAWFDVMKQRAKWVKELLDLMHDSGVSKNPEDDVKDWLRKMVLAGAPMSDITTGLRGMYLKLKFVGKVDRDELFITKVSHGSGFRRAYPRSATVRLNKDAEVLLENLAKVLSEVIERDGKAYIRYTEDTVGPSGRLTSETPIASALTEALITLAVARLGKPTIVVTDPKNLENALTMAELMKAVVIIDTPEQILRYSLSTVLNAQAPVFLPYIHPEFIEYFVPIRVGPHLARSDSMTSQSSAKTFISGVLSIIGYYYDVPNCESATESLILPEPSWRSITGERPRHGDYMRILLYVAHILKNRKIGDCTTAIDEVPPARGA